MQCPSCKAENDPSAENCFTCGKGLFVFTDGYVLASRYEIVAPLGKGGMGMVYKAHDIELDELVAVKVLRPEAANSPGMAKRFRSEIKLARRVSHPNVCRIHELGKEGALSYIVMEYVDGVDFKRILRERGRLPAPEAYGVTLQMADALQAIHVEGIIHRDLKTPNVMRNTRGLVKLMDFGIAKSFEGTTTATATGDVVGTPEYMSPEQAQGGKVDARSDIYALGIVTFELFTAEVPFRSDTPLATLLKQIHDRPPLDDTPGLPAALVPVLHKALAKTPVERFQSAHEFGEAVRLAAGPSLDTSRPARTAPIHASAAPLLVPETAPMPTPVPTAVPTVVPPSTAAARSPGMGETVGPPATRQLPPPPRQRRPPPQPTGSRGMLVGTVTLVALLAGGALWWMRSGGKSGPTPPPEPTAPPSTTTPAAPSPRPTALAAPEPLSPHDRSEISYPDPARTSTEISWKGVPGAASYHLIVDRGAGFSAPLVDRKEIPATTQQVRGLSAGEYRWRVAAVGPDGQEGAFSPALDFTIARTAHPGGLPRPGPAVATPVPAPVAPSGSGLTPVTTPPSLPPAPHPSLPTPGERAVSAPREEPSPVGTLQILVVPWAEVEVDNLKVGISPPLKPLALAAGVHAVKLSHPDYLPFRRKVTIRAGETTRLQVDLTKEAFPK